MDSTRFDETWFQDLEPEAKLVIFYLELKCDFAGIWIVNYKLMSLQLGIRIDEKRLTALLGDRLVFLSADRIYLGWFYEEQYGSAKDSFNAKRLAKERLEKLGIFDQNRGISDQNLLQIESIRDEGGQSPHSPPTLGGESPDSLSKSKSKSSIVLRGILKGDAAEVTSSDLEAAYQEYPLKKGKSAGLKKLATQVKTKIQLEEFRKAVLVYAASVAGTEGRYIKQFSTFVNSGWRDLLDPTYGQIDVSAAAPKVDWSFLEKSKGASA